MTGVTGARARTPEPDDHVPEPEDHLSEPDDQAPEPVQGRQKSTAGLKSLDPGAVLARLSVPISQTTAEIIEDMHGHYAVPDREQDPGVESGEYRT